jgi:hypothetical protein
MNRKKVCPKLTLCLANAFRKIAKVAKANTANTSS